MVKLPFEREIGDMLRQIYPLVGRCPDVRGQRYTSPKRFDYWSCDGAGIFTADECKATRLHVFEFSKIPAHQREALTTVIEAGGLAYLDLNLRGKRDPGLAWRIPWNQWLRFEKGWHKKSVRASFLAGAFREFELYRITGGWEVTNVRRSNIP